MCAVTLPTIQRYAKRIGADFNLITERKFPDYPINYERLQISELGKGYDWNFNIDADMLIGDQLYDPTDFFSDNVVGVVMFFKASDFFFTEALPFIRDGRDLGLVDAFVLTNRVTHDLWDPLPRPFAEYAHVFRDDNTRRISEYCLSLNLARYNHRMSGMFKRTDQLLHLNYTSSQNTEAVAIAEATLQKWGYKK